TIMDLQLRDIAKLNIWMPSSEGEISLIATFLSTVDKKISLLKQKHEQLVQYKKGIMQQLFSQQLRFKDDNGQDFPDWEVKHLSELADKVTKKNADDAVKSVLTNSAKHGIVNQLDYFDKDIANENNLTNYGVVEKDDFVYNPRISVHAPVGPIKRNHIGKGVMSPLYTVFRFKEPDLFDFLEIFFRTTLWHRYMNSIANFGARHDRMNITSGDFFALPIKVPCEEERIKLVDFVKSVDQKINLAQQQIEQTQTYKQGLLQQMFV
ncbi:MAG: type I restriction enzyme S subunit, partial [Reinekea sp.]